MNTHAAVWVLVAALLAPHASARADEIDQILKASCSSEAAAAESGGAALFALGQAATQEQRNRAAAFLRTAHDAMLAAPGDFPTLPYVESLKARPGFDALLGIANGNLRTANRLGDDAGRVYYARAKCMFQLARAFDAAGPPRRDDPQHLEVLHSIDDALECIADRAREGGSISQDCHEALDLSLPPALLERALKAN